jgi:hypothetical protein
MTRLNQPQRQTAMRLILGIRDLLMQALCRVYLRKKVRSTPGKENPILHCGLLRKENKYEKFPKYKLKTSGQQSKFSLSFG